MTEREIFVAAQQLSNDAERKAYLDQACGDDVELRARIEELLREHEQLGSFLEEPAPLGGTVDDPSSPRSPGELRRGGTVKAGDVLAGRYKLLERLGEGGMGTVWMAQQTEPVKRLVAVKLIKEGMDSKQVLARFEAERQALAVMDHPNIAKVHDAGITPEGKPFFVMELVKGVPITKYCDEHHLTPRQRLELFVPVCQAIQHAHQKGIIHRDLKPSNVLIALFDGRPVPKIIDFGVAKAAGQPLTERTLVTGFGAIVGTLEYMSPEQAELNNQDIDTRSDIYSLGVLLYELLTGTTPLSRDRLKQAAFTEMLRIIREEDPPKPSTRLSDSKDSLPAISALRHTEPGKLTKLVRGELDWIVMKALEKDRNRRYETANGFAMDVQRYLADEAVQACPPSAGYRFRKFARRNKAALVTTGLIGVSLLVAAIVSTWLAVRATRAENEATLKRAEAEASHKKARQAIEEYFTLVSESKLLNVPGLQPLRKQLLDSALRYYREMAENRNTDPVALADVAAAFLRVANVSHEVSRNDDALAAIDAGLDAVERLRREHPEARAALQQVAGYFKVLRPMSRQTGLPKDLPAAERTLNRFITIWETLAAEHPDVVGFQGDLGYFYALAGALQGGIGSTGDKTAFDRAVVLNSKAATIAERLSQANPNVVRYAENYATIQYDSVWLLTQAGRATEAHAALDRALAAFQKLADQHPDVPVYREWLGSALVRFADRLRSAGKKQEALVMARRGFDMLSDLAMRYPVIRSHSDKLMNSIRLLKVLAPESMPEVMTTWGKIIEKQPDNISLLAARGRWRLTVQQPQECLTDLARALELAPDDLDAPYWRMDRAKAYAALKQDQDSLTELTKATQTWPGLWETWVWRGDFHYGRRQWEKAIADFSKALELNPHYGLSGAPYWPAWKTRGAAYAHLKQWDRAIPDYAQAVEMNPKNATLHNDLAWLLATCPDTNLHQPARAVASAKKAVELSSQSGPFWTTLGVAQFRTGDWKAATESLTKSMKLSNGGDSVQWFFLAMTHWKLNEKKEARRWFDQAVEWMEKNASKNEELIRFRTEAQQVLEIKKQQP